MRKLRRVLFKLGRIHPLGEKGEVGSSVRWVDIGFIHGEEDKGMEIIHGGRYGRSAALSDGKRLMRVVESLVGDETRKILFIDG